MNKCTSPGLDNPEISGIEYQQGTLAGYETREYLLEKWGRECAYCGKKDTALQIEHIHPKAQSSSKSKGICFVGDAQKFEYD